MLLELETLVSTLKFLLIWSVLLNQMEVLGLPLESHVWEKEELGGNYVMNLKDWDCKDLGEFLVLRASLFMMECMPKPKGSRFRG